MNLRLPLAALLSAAAFLTTPSSEAAVLVSWNNYTTTPSYTPGTPILDPNVTGGTWSIGPGAAASAFGSGSAIVSATNMNAASFTSNDYFEFTLAPAPTYTLDLDTINLGYRGSATTTLTVRSSLDGYTANLITPFTPGSGVSTAVTLDSSFDNLSGPVTFRIYAWNSGGAGTVVGLTNAVTTNVVGTAVPEPTSALLFGLGAVVVLWRRRGV